MKKLRVLIVDDSPIMQSLLKRILSAEADIEVIGSASDAFEAREMIIADPPDVLTLDVEMPRMDGITFLKRLMSYKPLPVLMISSYTTENSIRTMEALEAGAVDFVPKPVHGAAHQSLELLAADIVAKVRAAGRANISLAPAVRVAPKMTAQTRASRLYKILAIGASTGGTTAIRRLLSSMNFHTNGILVVQHMPPNYTKSFAQRLNDMVPCEVVEAVDRERVEKDKVIIAQGGKHMVLARDRAGFFVRITDTPPVHHQKPSVDVLFESAAQVAGREAVGIILTGMGEDGARGLLSMREAGCFTVAQDEASSVVFGMPRAAIEMGAATRIASLDAMPNDILASAKLR
ncbi:protein-glutamate methylesterase/protein-glutamine glutaminase [Desulfatibacillum aliphaticivorans]|uniref:protein-glutamate methylesterase/protein-glutamine glutaminase n=1 Tax=Desulfatibacillum aliphaticivorans TaxID=218208 RepID=UPI00040060C7|nr:chemotaxis response regulator protein-glutamate methylesterase [Desulfatibacillum aliphaticivorans]